MATLLKANERLELIYGCVHYCPCPVLVFINLSNKKALIHFPGSGLTVIFEKVMKSLPLFPISPWQSNSALCPCFIKPISACLCLCIHGEQLISIPHIKPFIFWETVISCEIFSWKFHKLLKEKKTTVLSLYFIKNDSEALNKILTFHFLCKKLISF